MNSIKGCDNTSKLIALGTASGISKVLPIIRLLFRVIVLNSILRAFRPRDHQLAQALDKPRRLVRSLGSLNCSSVKLHIS